MRILSHLVPPGVYLTHLWSESEDSTIGCILLSQPFFWPREKCPGALRRVGRRPPFSRTATRHRKSFFIRTLCV